MTDSKTTTELIKKLVFDLRRLEYEADKPGSDMTLGEYKRKEAELIDECVQAIAATLESDRENELQAALNKAAGNWAKADKLARDMWGEMLHCPDYQVPPCMTADISEKMRELDMTNASDEQMAEYERMLAKAMTNKAVKQ